MPEDDPESLAAAYAFRAVHDIHVPTLARILAEAGVKTHEGVDAFMHKGTKACPPCKGFGYLDWGAVKPTCDNCAGTGRVPL